MVAGEGWLGRREERARYRCKKKQVGGAGSDWSHGSLSPVSATVFLDPLSRTHTFLPANKLTVTGGI